MAPQTDTLPVNPRFEMMPFPKGIQQAEELTEPVRLTVTASPKHGEDHTVETALRLRERGHAVTIHLAARMVRDRAHLDDILAKAAAAGIDDIFVVGGDAPEPHGEYQGALDILPLIAEHRDRPPRLGIGAYPEGHPLIADDVLRDVLERKAPMADYLATQMCFDAKVVLSWLEEIRGRGIDLPAYVGIPGPVERRKLLDISLKVGVGASVRFLRKQHGIKNLFKSPEHEANQLYDAIGPVVGDPRWNVAGFHIFTFNQLTDSVAWQKERQAAVDAAAAPAAS
mgnify:FL=1